MGKVKEIVKKGAAPQGQKKKITKPNTFGQYASNKASKKDKMLVNKDLIVQTLRAEKKGNSFKDGRLIEKKRLMKEEQFGGSLASVLQKGAYKKKKFDLGSDGEDDPNQDMPLRLTHKGKTLEDMDDYNDRGDRSSGDENIPAEIVDKLNFTGFDKEAVPNGTQDKDGVLKKKTKKEVYEEIIKKSKKMKYERQQQKEEDQGTLKELNEGYADIAQLLAFRTSYKGDERASVDEFDRLARDLQNEGRTQASTVIKKVEDKKERKLQEKRRKQLKGIMSSDGEDEKDLKNDDELETNTKKELSILKHMRKVNNLNKFIDQIKTVKQNAQKKKLGENGDDSEDEEEVDSLDEIDIDDDGEGEEEEDEDEDDGEHLELDDEFESDEEEGAGKKQKQTKKSDEEEDDGSEGDDEEEEDDEDEEEEINSDEYANDSD